MDFKAYIHHNRMQPRLVIPLTEELFLAWITPLDDGVTPLYTPEWKLRCRAELGIGLYIGGPPTVEELFESSVNMREATQLEILLYTNHSVGEIEEIIEDHIKTMPFISELSSK